MSARGVSNVHGVASPGRSEKDPVCGMTVDPASASSHAHGGQTYYFCCDGCRAAFAANPQKYIDVASAPEKAPASRVAAAVVWTCPMHPEIRRDGPGTCPICGMALEPLAAGEGEEESGELRDMRRRFWLSALLTLPLLLVGMADLLPVLRPLERLLPPLVQLLLASAVVLWGGWPFFRRGWDSLVHRSLNMFTLIALGTGVAYLESLAATLLPGLFPASFRGHGGA